MVVTSVVTSICSGFANLNPSRHVICQAPSNIRTGLPPDTKVIPKVTSRLTREEQKLLQPRKELKPRTYRVKVGGAIHLGGLARIDIVSAPAESIYLTVWAAAALTCHMGKIETGEELYEKHVGQRLQPPIGTPERIAAMGRWMSHTVEVKGDRWDQSCKDIAFAGIGWVGIAMSGAATLQIWTYEGLAVTVRDSMVLDMAAQFEKPGFSVEGKLPPKVAESGAKPREKRTSNNSKEQDLRREGAVKQSVVVWSGSGNTGKNSKASVSVRSARDGKRRANQ
ncbi:hypothetical protein CBR_g40558 [Chara braunii]|uniref:NOA1/YqeH-like C-terminal domain-containing protein n=1 Tax=Chara braunii TaxID=69332 RepID=A0A388K232_CHABU|nr:hypothetical protein CBR_g40558 [Chara braunii]|eukprot:GBG64110.1 hypothetical protein CBR_g40558 [Chara braunii]